MNYKKSKKRTVNKRKSLYIVLVCIAILGIVNRTWAYVDTQIKIKEEQQKIAEEKRKAEEDKKKYMVGVNHEAKKYSYDARIVSEKLKNGDYSNDGKKIVFLTFDDGTSKTVTPKVLKILKEENVKATFFLTGENIERGGEKAKDLIKEEFKEGHAIANHSYSHNYKILYPGRVLNLDAFKADFAKTDEMLTEILGKYFSTRVLRCPGGHMSWKGMSPLDEYLDENNMASIDWNALNGDAEGGKKNAQQLIDYAIKTSQGKEMVVLLMHDTYGKEETAKALPTIIKYFKDNGYEFKTLS